MIGGEQLEADAWNRWANSEQRWVCMQILPATEHHHGNS